MGVHLAFERHIAWGDPLDADLAHASGMGIGDNAAACLHQRHKIRHLLGVAKSDLRRAHGDHLAIAPEEFEAEGLFAGHF